MLFVMHSYTFRAYSLREAFQNARRFGWDGIELQPCHFNPQQIDTELSAAVSLGKSLGVPILCVDFGGDFIGDDPSIIEDSVHRLEHAIEVCAQCDVHLMNGSVGSLVVDRQDFGKNGSAAANDVHYQRAADAFQHLGAFASQRGVQIVFEIHMNSLHDTAASTARLLDLIGHDNVKANPDPGNMFSTPTAEKNPSCLDMLAGRIGYFHFKNCVEIGGKYNYGVKLADGHIDIFKWLWKLVILGYDGPVCVEFCGAGDPHVAAEHDIQYMRKGLEWLRSK